ncbi:MAG: DUF1211 domain-containing protein, partial [Chthonomonadaceae bacterium]|nr:DUF1211 domain-containing protein [Chthonomonadaceae bacterium]
MTKTRLEAFSDGVIAIIITIMVLELRPPSAMDWHSLRPLAPVFLSYLLSFVILGEYWANHHHVLQAVKHVGGTALWANLHLLFWMSLYPFATSWLGKTNFESIPLFFFGVIQFCSAVAYFVLVRILIRDNSNDSPLVIAV